MFSLNAEYRLRGGSGRFRFHVGFHLRTTRQQFRHVLSGTWRDWTLAFNELGVRSADSSHRLGESDFPSIGSMVSYLGEESSLPPRYAIPRHVAHDKLYYAGTHAGFLGSAHDPVEVGEVFNHVQVGPRPDAENSEILLGLPDDVSIDCDLVTGGNICAGG